MRYIAWDMSQAWKRYACNGADLWIELIKSGNDVMGAIEDVCEESIQATKFFHGGPSRSEFGQVLVQCRGNPLTISVRNGG